MVNALQKEIELKARKLQKPKLSTIYFGGGTPSILSPGQVSILIEEIKNQFDLSKMVEFTFEMNPEHASENYLSELFELGINRISLGIQTFSDQALIKLNRGHSKKIALNPMPPQVQLKRSGSF